MPLNPARTFGYVRVSTEEQVKEGHSLAGQERYLKVWCADEHWPAPTRIFRDEGLSGSDPSRPQLALMVEQLREGDLLVLTHPDRLSRDTEHLLGFLRKISERKVALRFGLLGPEFDPLTEVGRLVVTILVSLSEFFLADMKRKSRIGIEQASIDGIKFGRPPRFFNVVKEKGRDVLVASLELLEIAESRKNGVSLGDLATRYGTNRKPGLRSIAMLAKWDARESPWLMSKAPSKVARRRAPKS